MRDAIDMASEAGMKFSPAQFSGVLEAEIDEFSLKAFVELVRADEREACAKVCDELHPGLATKRAAELIRARGGHMIEPWTWKQAVAFLIIWTVVCGPWLYMAWQIRGRV